MPNAVRTHLIADHKRSAAEADELIARFAAAKPITEPEAKPHTYSATAQPVSSARSGDDNAAAPEMPVN
jgi:hypothetical protein